MGSILVMNDTLQITSEEGFPERPELEKEYSFKKEKLRQYRLPPVRVFLAHNIEAIYR